MLLLLLLLLLLLKFCQKYIYEYCTVWTVTAVFSYHVLIRYVRFESCISLRRSTPGDDRCAAVKRSLVSVRSLPANTQSQKMP